MYIYIYICSQNYSCVLLMQCSSFSGSSHTYLLQFSMAEPVNTTEHRHTQHIHVPWEGIVVLLFVSG